MNWIRGLGVGLLAIGMTLPLLAQEGPGGGPPEPAGRGGPPEGAGRGDPAGRGEPLEAGRVSHRLTHRTQRPFLLRCS